MARNGERRDEREDDLRFAVHHERQCAISRLGQARVCGRRRGLGSEC